LVSDLLSRSLPIKKIQLWPKKLEVCIADKGALLTNAQRQNCITYFIGFQIDKLRMRGEQLNVEMPLQNFREWDLSRYQPLIPGMDLLVKSFKCTTLPKICFEGIYDGGKFEAMKKRRQIRDTDPIRQEKKRVERLEELKAKMAEIQRKKDEKEQDKKRKREEADESEIDAIEQQADKVVKKEEEVSGIDIVPSSTEIGLFSHEEGQAGAVIESDETDLLESALDTFQDTAGEVKTREEAEQDRQKLLAGEFLTQLNAETDDIVYASDEEENAVGYTGDGARQVYFKKIAPTSSNLNEDEINNNFNGIYYDDDGITMEHKDKRSLPIPKHVADTLRSLNYHFVSDDEMKILGNNLLPPWRNINNDLITMKEQRKQQQFPKRVRIQFLNKFNIVELDPHGNVIDQGDDDYTPSKQFTGTVDGFEFKMGLRGLGYYRTGKEVVIPSNTAY
jgi:hypothetical protein